MVLDERAESPILAPPPLEASVEALQELSQPIARSPRKLPAELVAPTAARMNAQILQEDIFPDVVTPMSKALLEGPTLELPPRDLATVSPPRLPSPEVIQAPIAEAEQPPNAVGTSMPAEPNPTVESLQRPTPGEQAVLDEVAQRRDLPPDLPPTPVQRGLDDPVVTTPPTGIHDTPSKRPRRRKTGQQSPSLLKPTASPQKAKSPPRPTVEKTPETEIESSTEHETEQRYPLRQVDAIDPLADRRKLREQLLEEIQQLQVDVRIAEKESERLRTLHESGGIDSEPENREQLLELLTRTRGPAVRRSSQTATIFSRITSFLPFGAVRREPKIEVKREDIPSHAPLAQDEPLPFLQVFSPLSYTSTTTLLPPTPSSSEDSSAPTALLRQHLITASHPSGLFSARLRMIVDATNLSIESMDILSMSEEASSELGTWAARRARSDGILGRAMSTICWGMGRWVEVSIERAKFWSDVDRLMGDATTRRITISKMQHRLKRKRTEELDGEGDELGGETEDHQEKWTRQKLQPLMGKQQMTILGDVVHVTIFWTIDFDWTGEVESHLKAAAVHPSACECILCLLDHQLTVTGQGADERDSLRKIPKTFERLVQSKGRLEAVKALVALLMPVR